MTGSIPKEDAGAAMPRAEAPRKGQSRREKQMKVGTQGEQDINHRQVEVLRASVIVKNHTSRILRELIKLTGEENRSAALAALRILAGGEPIVSALEEEQIAEIEQCAGDEKKIGKIITRYAEMKKKAVKRGLTFMSEVTAMKKSGDRNMKAFGYDLEIAAEQATMAQWQISINKAREMINKRKKTKEQPQTTGDTAEEQPLTQEDITKLENAIKAAQLELEKCKGNLLGVTENGVQKKKGLIQIRKEAVGSYEEVPDKVASLAMTLAGNNKADQKSASENSVDFIQSKLIAALGDETAMNDFIEVLAGSGLIDKNNKSQIKKLINDIRLGKDPVEVAWEYGKRGALVSGGFLALLVMLGYMGAKMNGEKRQ